VLKERVEAQAEKVLQPLFDALDAERAVIVSTGGNTTQQESHIEFVPDYPTRIVAVRELLDRGYGRPKQVADITVVTEDALAQKVREWEAEADERERDRTASVAGAVGESSSGATPA
jgi:hypothetical protein